MEHLSPSNEGARALLDFFRARDAEGQLVWRFDGDDTRFLGDLYQDLSEDVRKRYALLQTPELVESRRPMARNEAVRDMVSRMSRTVARVTPSFPTHSA